MEKEEKVREILRMIVVLTVISAAMGFGLSFVESITREPIKLSRLKYVKGPAVLAVLPEFENDPVADYKEGISFGKRDGKEIVKTVFPAKKGGKITAIAFEVQGQGFGGKLDIMIGVDVEKNILTGMRVMRHSETPGLGARSTEPSFYKHFVGKSLKELELKDRGGKIDAISGATITSGGVVSAVREGLKEFINSKEKILKELKAS